MYEGEEPEVLKDGLATERAAEQWLALAKVEMKFEPAKGVE